MNPLAQKGLRIVVTLLVVAAAGYGGRWLWVRYNRDPWTRDGRLRADVVLVSPDINGLVTTVLVKDGQKVRIGRHRFRQRDGLIHGRPDRVRVEPVSRGAGSLVVQLHAHREPLRLLGHVLMNGIVGEPRERLAMSSDQSLYVGNAERFRCPLDVFEQPAAFFECQDRRRAIRHKPLRS